MEYYRKNCVIAAVGHNSLHKEWKKGSCLFDLHLIVYDDSIELFRGDADAICHIKGFKLKIVYQYLIAHPELLEKYEYFFIPDDDIRMDADTINSLFEAMRKYELRIAQPSLRCMSYYTWWHTLQNCNCKLRYTNFVEMMVPCFSQEALKKVLFTFNENDTGWGTETHWPLLIETNHRDMAIIDEVSVLHTRPIQSGTKKHQQDLASYLHKYNLRTEILEFGYVSKRTNPICGRANYAQMVEMLEYWSYGNFFVPKEIGLNGCLGYCYLQSLLTCLTNSRRFVDRALVLFEKMSDYVCLLENNMNFHNGVTGCCWLVLFLAENKMIEGNPLKIIQNLDEVIRQYEEKHLQKLTVDGVAGIGRFYLEKQKMYPIKESMNRCVQIAMLLQEKLTNDILLENTDVSMDILDLLRFCKLDISEFAKKVERFLRQKKHTSIEQVYLLMRLFLLTKDEFFLVKIKEELKILPTGLFTLKDAVKLAEVLFVITKIDSRNN